MKKDNEMLKLKLTAFNTAMGSMLRLNDIINACVIARTDLDVYHWLINIRNFYDEIDAKMTPEERTKVRMKLNAVQPMAQIAIEQFKKNPYDARISNKLFHNLEEIELLLRRIADKKGLLNPDKMNVLDSLLQEDKDE